MGGCEYGYMGFVWVDKFVDNDFASFLSFDIIHLHKCCPKHSTVVEGVCNRKKTVELADLREHKIQIFICLKFT